MENEELIRQQMENTRTSITEKLETLEDKVTGDIQDATGAVANTVVAVTDSVKETVNSVKESVEGTAEAMKEAVQESVEAVKNWFDLSEQVHKRPWTVLACSACVGACLESLTRERAASPEPGKPASSGHGRSHHNGNGAGRRRSEKSSSFSLINEWGPQISKLKGLAMGALLGSVRGMIMKSVPPEAGNTIKEIIDEVAQKLGAEKVIDLTQRARHSDVPFEGENHGDYDQFDRPKMGRSMGPTGG